MEPILMNIRNLVKLEFYIIQLLFSYKSNILPILGSYLISPLIMYMYNVFLSLKALYNIKNIIYLIILLSHLIFLIILLTNMKFIILYFMGLQY